MLLIFDFVILTEKLFGNDYNFQLRIFADFFGSASFVVMDTDYDNYAMICTCQSKKILFDALTFHRRSCTILQRSPERDTTITNEVRFYSQEFYFLINVRWIIYCSCRLSYIFIIIETLDEKTAQFRS